MERRLLGLLIRRGSSRDSAEDVGQEVAIRAYRAMPAFASADELFWWCSTVARRLVIDEHRKTSRLSLVAAVPEGGDQSVNLAGDYERRELVRAVLAEFDRLPEAQKQAFASQGSRSDPSTIDVRRHRARRRLLGVVEAFGAVLGWIVARGRATRPALLLTSSAAALSVVFVTGVGLPSWSTPTPSSPTVTASVTATRSTGRPPARSAAAAAPRAARKALAPEHHWSVAPPIRPVVSQPTPGHGDLSAGIEEGGDRAPLSCVRLKVSPTPFCVDYPARP